MRNLEEVRSMEQEQFWKLIQTSREESNGDCDSQVERLQELLTKLPPKEIIDFDRHLVRLRQEAYRWDLWGAAYLLNGGCSDDGFEYFRCWLITQGEAVYTEALRDPDSLARFADPTKDDFDCEALLDAAGYAYE